MKRLLLIIAIMGLMLASAAVAQDPDDPGMPDSLIFSAVEVEHQPGDTTQVSYDIYFVTDDSISSLLLPVGWQSEDGGIVAVSATWMNTLQQWESTFANDEINWLVGFNDLTSPYDEPALYTDSQRLVGVTINFIVLPDAQEQVVWIDTTRGPNNLPVNFGLVHGSADITPIVVPGYIRYGAVGINDETAALPSEYELGQNYPNPFNPETNIEFQVPRASQVDIEIYNILGRKVKTLVAGYKEAGFYTTHWDGTNENGAAVPSGVYFYRMTAGDYTVAKKMVMLR